MGGVNRGKKFESVIRESFEKVDGVSIDRLNDQMGGYANIATISDFIVYKEPYEYYIECKSVHGNTFSIHSNDPKKKYGLITNNQWQGMLEKSKIQGVFAGVIVWFIDLDGTYFLPIQYLEELYNLGHKSISGKLAPDNSNIIKIQGKKKRVFFEYDMQLFLETMELIKGV